MANLNLFRTWDEMADYVENTMGIKYTDNPTAWAEAMKELNKGYKYVKIVNDVTGETSSMQVPEGMLAEGVGEWHVGDNSQSAQTISGGGVKSAPTAKSIITNNSGGGTAVKTEEAIGVKDTGIVSAPKAIGVISGLLQIYGLIHAGIKVANAQVWKDMANYVFDTDFTDDTPFERVIDFWGNKIVNSIIDLNSDGKLITTIPDSIAEKMYNFLAAHMVEQTEPGVYPDIADAIDTFYNFIHRTLTPSYSGFTLERYFSVTNPTTEYLFYIVKPSDDLFKSWMEDFLLQLIAGGYNVPSNVGTALIAGMSGIMLFLKEMSVDAVDEAEFARCIISFSRSSSVPKTQPLSLGEIRTEMRLFKDEKIPIHSDENGRYIVTDMNVGVDHIWPKPALVSGQSYQAGDMVRYAKRTGTGEHAVDYAYTVRCSDAVQSNVFNRWGVDIIYVANEQHKTYSQTVNASGFQSSVRVNGFTYDLETELTTGTGTLSSEYSNLGYKGNGISYAPDDYLVTAGFRSKEDSSGNPEKTPNPTKTKEEQYPMMADKKQVANPQARIESGAVIVDNDIKGYVPTSVPAGSSNASRLIEHGLNNPDDPESYIDNRPQGDKEQGIVNTNDPVDGINEDIQSNIDDYNDSRNDPGHYPDPIPENEPNPQYPTNPPSEPGGDSGDTPDPGLMPGVTASGMVSVYNPTKAEIINFSGWLWSTSVMENLKRLLADPMDAIIGLHIMYATPVTGAAENIIAGYLDSQIPAKVVTKQFIEISCGSVVVPEFYGNVFDYEPYTQIHMYLPFVGIVAIKANDVVGKKVTVKYGIDVLTGTCLAMVNTEKGESNIQCYQFAGNCAVQIPLTGGNYAGIIRSLASMTVGVAGSVLSGNPLPAIGGVIGGAMGASLDVSHSGSLGANAGVLGIRKPYIIITRRIAYEAQGYNQFYGFPANLTVTLGSCKGYTRVKSVHIDSISKATDTEKTEIETLLRQGVIIK